jgi:hypothetical protein
MLLLFISLTTAIPLVTIQSEAQPLLDRQEKLFELPVTSLCAYIRDNVEQLDNSGIVVMQKHHNRIMGATNKK